MVSISHVPPIDRVLSLLPDAKPAGTGKWTSRCPAHEDRSPSLSIGVGDDGAALVHCFTGCTPSEVVAALGLTLADLMPPRDEPQRRITVPSHHGQHTGNNQTHNEVDWQAEAELYAVALTPERRAELAAVLGLPQAALQAVALIGYSDTEKCWTFPERGGDGKIIGISRRWAEAKKKSMQGSRRGLTIPEDWGRGETIFLPEGQSNTLALAAMGLSAIGRPSNTGGIELLAEFLTDLPSDRQIVVVGDFDPKPSGHWPGREGAVKVATELAVRLNRPVSWTMPPDATKDVRAWAIQRIREPENTDAWHDAAELFSEGIKGQMHVVRADAEPGPAASLPIITAGELLDTYRTMRPPIIEGLLRAGETMNLISAPKVGKSWCAIGLGFAVATGRLWLDTFATTKGKVLMIDNELHAETIAQRLRRMAEACAVPMELIREMVHVLSLRGRLKDLRRLAAGLRQLEHGSYSLLIVDAFYRTLPMDVDENSNGTMSQLYNEIDAFADHLGAATTLIHHASKGNQSEKSVTDVGSGAGAQSRATDTHLILRPHEDDDVFVLDAAVRSFPPVAPRCLRWSFPLWTPAPDLDPTALRSPRPRRRNKPDADAPPTPPESPWTAKRFTDAFGKPEPRTRAAILEDARLMGLSDRRAKDLLQAALEMELLFAQREKGWGAKFTVTNTRPAAEKPRPKGSKRVKK